MSFNLPPLDGKTAPVFSSAGACRTWVHSLPLTNPAEVQAQLAEQIDRLNRYPVDPAERLAMLDALRKTVYFAQEENAKRFAGKALPLSVVEQSAFDAAQVLWQALVTGYLRCVEDSPDNPALTALGCQRALSALTARQRDMARTRTLPPPYHWFLLNRTLARAEGAKVADRAVDDALIYGKTATTALAAYAEAMLLHAASPYELPLRQLAWTIRWARRWSSKLALLTAPPAEIHSIPLQIDLDSEEPAGLVPRHGHQPRFLDTTALRKSLRSRLALLDQGRDPAEMQLGDDCTQPACGILLGQLLQRWCNGGIPRKTERQPMNKRCRTISGTESIHFQLAGHHRIKQAAPPPDAQKLRIERERMATFGDTESHRVNPSLDEPPTGFAVEDHWTVLDESATGLRLSLTARQAVGRLNLHQLIAIQAEGMARFLLATVQWLTLDADGQLQIGARLLPGPAIPVAVRNAGLNTAREPLRPGFLLPALAALDEPASALVPAGTFRPGRVLDVLGEDTRQLKLTALLERGEDFERVRCE